MPRPKKLICHDCGTIFNRKPANGDKQVCWNCRSMSVTLVTDTVTPPPAVPQAPDPSGLKMPVITPRTSGGAITPELLLRQRALLKKVVRPPVVLPGATRSVIAKGVRVLAHQVRNPIIRSNEVEAELVWKERGSTFDSYAYLPLAPVDLARQLNDIASGKISADHTNANTEYRNYSRHLPTRKGPREADIFRGIKYFEYGWKRVISSNSAWYSYNNNVRSAYSRQSNQNVNAFVRNLRQGRIFSERLIIAETGEIFYTPDHYGTFFRYHPGTMDWYRYRSAGSTGPTWDESFYEEPTGA